jgi:epoxyqueuosine reductase
MTIGDYLKKRLIEKGASIVGFAELSSVPVEVRKGLPYGIVFGVALDPAVVPGIKGGPTMEYYNEYKRINTLLNGLGDYTERLLKDNGYAALAKTQKVVVVDDSTEQTELPHKTVATRAGIGWIGKSALLVTEEYGSALRISSVLTNAELKAGTPVNSSRCGDCSICKDFCPGEAISGKVWEVGMDREEFFHAFDCRRAALERSGKIGLKETICGLCIMKCPWTQRYLKRSINAAVEI